MNCIKRLHCFNVKVYTKDSNKNTLVKIKIALFINKLKQRFTTLKKKFKDYMLKNAIENSGILLEPTYNITREEFDMLMKKIDEKFPMEEKGIEK